jgi:hypothetical protein
VRLLRIGRSAVSSSGRPCDRRASPIGGVFKIVPTGERADVSANLRYCGPRHRGHDGCAPRTPRQGDAGDWAREIARSCVASQKHDHEIGAYDGPKGLVLSGLRPPIKAIFGAAPVVGAVISSAFCAEIGFRWP